VDVIHVNLHKTSPSRTAAAARAGPVASGSTWRLSCRSDRREDADRLRPRLRRPQSIGRVRSFAASFGVMVRSYAYIRSLGPDGLKLASETAVLNANYIMNRLKADYHLPYDRVCKHECVFSDAEQLKNDVKTSTLPSG